MKKNNLNRYIYALRNYFALGGVLGKMGTAGGGLTPEFGGVVSALQQAVPDQTTGSAGKQAKQIGQTVVGAVGSAFGVPFAGEAMKLSDFLGSAITGDGKSGVLNTVANTINPLNSTIGAIADGRPLEAIPLAGGAIKAARLNSEEQEQIQKEYKENSQRNIERSRGILAGYPTSGIKAAQLFGKYGMKLNFATGGIIPEEGGTLMPISSTGAAVVGNKHEQGGVKVNANGVPAELEGGEGVHTLPNGEQLVSSASVPSSQPDESGQLQSIADAMQKLEKEKAKYEELLKFRPNDARIANVIEKIDKELMSLAQEQEAIMGREIPQEAPQAGANLDAMANEQMSPQEYGGQMEMKYGGRLSYETGGQPPRPLWKKPTTLAGQIAQAPVAIMRNMFTDNPVFPLYQQSPKSNDLSFLQTLTQPTSLSTGPIGNPLRIQGGAGTGLIPMNNPDIVPSQNNLTVPKDNSNVLSNFGIKMGNMNFNQAAPFIDNIANVMLNQQRAGMNVPRQNLDNMLNPRLVNYDDQRQEAIRQQRGFNQNIMFNNSNAGTANANLAAGLAQAIRARNEINRNEANTNQGILAQTDLANSQIQSRNNATTYRDDIENFKFRESLLGKTSENIADMSKDLQVQNRDAKAEKLFAEQQAMQFMVLDEEKQITMYEQYPELIAKIAPDWVKNYKLKQSKYQFSGNTITGKTTPNFNIRTVGKPIYNSTPVKTN